jgi:tetratricopeptide (TPR) repeat protein
MARALQSVLAGVVAIGVIGVVHHWLGAASRSSQSAADQASAASRHLEQSALQNAEQTDVQSPFAVQRASTEEVLASVNAAKAIAFSPDVAELVAARKYNFAKKRLLELASLAVESGDQSALARVLAELGEVALAQTDIDAAELYLAEALDVYQQLGDEVSIAGVFMQFGRLHLLERERARQASDAYDQLLVARWKISHNQFDQAEPRLKQIASTNLQLNRFGAAASAYETLFRGYAKTSQFEQAQQAGLEAARLHAASGRVFEARAMLGRMLDAGISKSVFEGFEREIERLTKEYEDSVNAIAVARDQEQLYNQLLARGDVVQAWRFREKAGQSRSKASSRAQYRRQPDVLVELYRSNNSMENARVSLQRAREMYLRHGLETRAQQSEELQSRIY